MNYKSSASSSKEKYVLTITNKHKAQLKVRNILLAYSEPLK